MTESVTIVYAVSSGSYDDYAVDCLFTTRELAIEYADRRNYLNGSSGRSHRDFHIEEFHLYDGAPELVTVTETVEEERFVGRKAEIDQQETRLALEEAREAEKAEKLAAAYEKAGLTPGAGYPGTTYGTPVPTTGALDEVVTLAEAAKRLLPYSAYFTGALIDPKATP